MAESSPPPSRFGWLLKILINPAERRPRAGWRILFQMLLYYILVTMLGVGLGIALIGASQPDIKQLAMFGQVVALLAVLLSVYITCGYLDQRPLLNLGLRFDRRRLTDLLAGTGIAAVLMLAIFSLHWLIPGVMTLAPAALTELPGTDLAAEVGFYLALFVIVAVSEELLARGYWLVNLKEGLNAPLAVLLSSLAFGALHLDNPGATWLAGLNISLAGALFAFATLRSGSLWLAIGLHFGWNFFEGVIFGFPVSGLAIPGLLAPQVSGPDWLTGGKFGPEGGVLLLPALLIGFALVVLYTRFISKEN